MKKLHFSLLAVLFALFAMVSFTACSSDDDDNVPSTEEIKSNIVGKWMPTHISGWDYDEKDNPIKVDQDIPLEESEGLLFKGDGTYKWCWYSDGSWSYTNSTYKYEISGNRIILYEYNGDIDITYTVLSYKNDVVVLQYTLEEGSQYKTTITCKRVD